MRFLMIIKADANSEAGLPPEPQEKFPELMAAMAKFSEDMAKAGVLLATDGLAPSSQGLRLVASGGKLAQVDGPFAETKELIAGYALIQVASKEEAIEVGLRFMQLHQQILGPSWEGVSEIRQVFGPSDFPQ